MAGRLDDRLPPGPQSMWQAIRDLQRQAAQRASRVLPALRRTDQSIALDLSQPTWAWLDRSGQQVLAEDPVSGLGLPYLPIMFAPARYTDWPATTGGTFEDIWRATISRQQAYAYLAIGATTDASGTTGELQVTLNGQSVGSVIPVAFTVTATTIGPIALPGPLRGQVEIRVQARRTAGAGNVRCAVLAASGIQS